MKVKTVVTLILILFVSVSITYMVLEEIGGKSQLETMTQDIPPTDNLFIDTPVESTNPNPPESLAEDVLIVYYFHGYYRCYSCLTIEKHTREAITTGFERELKDGRLVLRVLNMQDPLNESYVDDFQLQYYIVVLERIENGKRQDWKKLEDVWDLYNNKDMFIEYVQKETRDYLKGL